MIITTITPAQFQDGRVFRDMREMYQENQKRDAKLTRYDGLSVDELNVKIAHHTLALLELKIRRDRQIKLEES